MNVVAIIAAGGVGKRLKARRHKPFVRLAGRPMLAWTLSALERAAAIDGIVVVSHRDDVAKVQRLSKQYRYQKVIRVVPGGVSRMSSVFRGLEALPPSAEWVVVHDGARPFVTPALIQAALRAARQAKAVVTAVPVVPTIKRARGRWVEATLNRNHLWAVQTPQVFHRNLLKRAHAKAMARGATATDDATLVEALGHRVRIVPGDHRNIKVTTPDDLIVAEAFLKQKRSDPLLINALRYPLSAKNESRTRV